MNCITKAYLGFSGITKLESPLGSSAIAIDYGFRTKKVLLTAIKITCSKDKIKHFSKNGLNKGTHISLKAIFTTVGMHVLSLKFTK